MINELSNLVSLKPCFAEHFRIRSSPRLVGLYEVLGAGVIGGCSGTVGFCDGGTVACDNSEDGLDVGMLNGIKERNWELNEGSCDGPNVCRFLVGDTAGISAIGLVEEDVSGNIDGAKVEVGSIVVGAVEGKNMGESVEIIKRN